MNKNILIGICITISMFTIFWLNSQYHIFDDKPIQMVQPDSEYIVSGGVVIPLTKLSNEDIKIQEEEGCKACHKQ